MQEIYDKMIRHATEADFAQKILDEMCFRGVTDHIALSVVSIMRDRANQRYEERRRQYARHARRAEGAASDAVRR